MNLGTQELGILAVLVFLFLGGKIALKPKESKKSAKGDSSEPNIMANFQNVNSDYDNTPVKSSVKSPSNKKTA